MDWPSNRWRQRESDLLNGWLRIELTLPHREPSPNETSRQYAQKVCIAQEGSNRTGK
jgi:hypothetical protein